MNQQGERAQFVCNIQASGFPYQDIILNYNKNNGGETTMWAGGGGQANLANFALILWYKAAISQNNGVLKYPSINLKKSTHYIFNTYILKPTPSY